MDVLTGTRAHCLLALFSKYEQLRLLASPRHTKDSPSQLRPHETHDAGECDGKLELRWISYTWGLLRGVR